MTPPSDPEDSIDFWELLLSRQPEVIEKIYQVLQEAEQQAVLTHLTRMRDEDGWLPQQRCSARFALDVIENLLYTRPINKNDGCVGSSTR